MSQAVPVYEHSFELGKPITQFCPEEISCGGREILVSCRSLLSGVYGLAQVDPKLVEHGD